MIRKAALYAAIVAGSVFVAVAAAEIYLRLSAPAQVKLRDGEDENKVAAQQVSYIIAGVKKGKMEIPSEIDANLLQQVIAFSCSEADRSSW